MTALPLTPIPLEIHPPNASGQAGRYDAYRRLASLAFAGSSAAVYLIHGGEAAGELAVVAEGFEDGMDSRAAHLARRVTLAGEVIAIGGGGDAGTGGEPSASFLGVPIGSSEAPYSGCLCVMHPGEREWTQEEVAALTDLAGMIERDTGRRPAVEEKRALETVVRMLAKAVDNMQLGVTITDLTGRIVYTNPAEARMHGYRVDELLGRSARLLGPPENCRALPPLDRDAAVSWTRETVNVRRDGTRFEVLLWSDVVTDAAGQPIGLVTCCEDITDRKRAEQRLRDVALRDPLTSLPNRTHFHDRLSRAIERQRSEPARRFAVLFLDLDRFKVVNDSLGHHVGDDLLRVVAERLLHCVRPDDTVARFGGDEFAVLLEDTGAGDTALRIAERIIRAIGAPMELGGYDLVTSASVGVVQSAAHMTQPEYVWQAADMAMYRAKAAGPGRFEVFDRGMHLEAMSRLRIETDLRRALEAGEFRLEYQPVVALPGTEVVGFEALLRWRHAERGELQPSDFMAVAEETGLILRLGEWVVREACREASRWQGSEAGRGRWVAINLAGKQLSQPQLAERVHSAIDEAGLDPALVQLEITEISVMDGAETAAATLRELRDLGVRLVLDDFGTGYSSLSYLHRLPIDAVKIDRTFVEGLRAGDRQTRVVEGVVRLARNAGLCVIAEGVSDPTQLEVLQGLGCHQAQGYLFAPALEPDRIPAYVAARARLAEM